MPARGALRGRRGRPGRPRDGVAIHAGAAPRPLRPHGHAGHGARSAARDSPGRRRRLRRQERVRRRGSADRLARASPRHARPLDGDAEREHDRAPARPRRSGSSSRSAGRATAKLLAYRIDILADAGAYPGVGAYLPNLTGLLSSGVYAIPRIEVEGLSVVTNTTPMTTIRGAGRPEAAQAIERMVDLFAAEIEHGPRRAQAEELHRQGRVPATRPPRVRRTTRATTKGRSTSRCAPSATQELRAEQQASPRRRRRRSSSGSGSARTSRSRTRWARRSTARSRSPPTAAQSCTRARSRTARDTRRPSR